MLESGKWIKDIQATKHEHPCVSGNKNIQSKFKKAHIRVMEKKIHG